MVSPAGPVPPGTFSPTTLTRLDLESGRAITTSIEELGEYEAEALAVGEDAIWVIGAGTPQSGGTLTRITS